MSRDMAMGLTYLGLNLLISVAAQFVLKAAMKNLGGFEADGGAMDYFLHMLNWEVIGGLFLYASGTILWLMCLTKLDLSFAYPAATMQYFLIFLGAWWFFGESIGWMKMAGLFVIVGGVIVMSLDKEKS